MTKGNVVGVNIFFCNGFMSALSSCLIADFLHEQNSQSVSVLCIEQNRHVPPVYYQALDILVAQNDSFIEIVRVSVEFQDLSLRKPVRYIQSVANYRNIAIEVANQLGIGLSKSISTIWAPTTSRLWPFFMKKGVEFNLIEHGLGEYIEAITSKPRTLKSILVAKVVRVLGYRTVAHYKSLWLCSHAVIATSNKKVVQKNCVSEFAAYVDGFWQDYQRMFPVPAKELLGLASRVAKNRSDVYLYLPSDELRLDIYDLFVKEQMAVLAPGKNALFIIKNHPGRVGVDYGAYLSAYGAYLSISELENCYLPAEFIARIIDIGTVVGSGSSALFYLKSWLPNTVTRIYNNYGEDWLSLECESFKSQLDAAGLINRMPN